MVELTAALHAGLFRVAETPLIATGDAFSGGLTAMANYVGNVILPICAALVIGMGVYAYSQRRDGQRLIMGGLACLLVSGFVREAEFFIGTTTGSAMFMTGMLGMVNWFCNVILPLYSVFCFVRGVLALGGFMDNFNIGDDWARFFLTGAGCLSCSWITRLIEYFVVTSHGGLH